MKSKPHTITKIALVASALPDLVSRVNNPPLGAERWADTLHQQASLAMEALVAAREALALALPHVDQDADRHRVNDALKKMEATIELLR